MLKLLRENIGNILQDFELDKNFLKRTSVAEKLTLEKWMPHRMGEKTLSQVRSDRGQQNLQRTKKYKCQGNKLPINKRANKNEQAVFKRRDTSGQ